MCKNIMNIINVINISIADMLDFVPRTLLIMFISISATWGLIDRGILDRIGKIGSFLVPLLRLPGEVAFTFVISIGSLLSGNIMLSDLNKKGILTEYQTYLGALFNSISVYIKESFTYQMPVIIPILGLKVGLVYFTCFLSSSIMILIFIVIKTRLRYTGADKSQKYNNNFLQKNKIHRLSYFQQLKIFLKLATMYVCITFVIFCCINSGVISYIEKVVVPVTDILGLPDEIALPVGTYIFSPIAGATTIGTMINDGKIVEIDAMLACLLGSFLMLPIFVLRGGLAKYTSIFGFSLGVKIVTTSTMLGLSTRLLFIICILMIRGVM
ncbi:MAG: hypothetical protein AB1765_02470 [Candidatus Hydrogenedentota bacterium]